MRRIALFVFAIGFLIPWAVAPAHAQATRTWVSGVGDDMSPSCSRTAPCKTFAAAIALTAPGGEINCVDSGGFGNLTIMQSITIACDGTIGGVLGAMVTGITINAADTDFVLLKGLDFEGATNGLIGIRVLKAGLVHVEDCNIRGFKAASPNGFGIRIEPSANLHFVIARTTIFNNGIGATGAGILVRPTGGVTTGVLDKVIIDRNSNGVIVDGFAGTGGVNVAVRDSTISGNAGVGAVVTSSVFASLIVKSSTVVGNATGLLAANAGASVRVSASTIAGNSTAIAGPVLSFGNNEIINNAGGETIGSIALK